jgi:hypothetical protein
MAVAVGIRVAVGTGVEVEVAVGSGVEVEVGVGNGVALGWGSGVAVTATAAVGGASASGAAPAVHPVSSRHAAAALEVHRRTSRLCITRPALARGKDSVSLAKPATL